jgi:hypothetical protein
MADVLLMSAVIKLDQASSSCQNIQGRTINSLFWRHSSYVLITNFDALRGMYCLKDTRPFQTVSDCSVEMSSFGRYSSWNLLRCEITGKILKSFSGLSKLLLLSLSVKCKNLHIISTVSHVIMSLNPVRIHFEFYCVTRHSCMLRAGASHCCSRFLMLAKTSPFKLRDAIFRTKGLSQTAIHMEKFLLLPATTNCFECQHQFC